MFLCCKFTFPGKICVSAWPVDPVHVNLSSGTLDEDATAYVKLLAAVILGIPRTQAVGSSGSRHTTQAVGSSGARHTTQADGNTGY